MGNPALKFFKRIGKRPSHWQDLAWNLGSWPAKNAPGWTELGLATCEAIQAGATNDQIRQARKIVAPNDYWNGPCDAAIDRFRRILRRLNNPQEALVTKAKVDRRKRIFRQIELEWYAGAPSVQYLAKRYRVSAYFARVFMRKAVSRKGIEAMRAAEILMTSVDSRFGTSERLADIRDY